MDIEHIEPQFRFQTGQGDARSVLDYRVHDDRMTILHTFVPPACRGQGAASQLTKAALDWAKDRHLKVVPACSYASAYIQRHSEYQELVS